MKKALVISYSETARDPRVLRQVEWLHSNGFEVTTLGLGEIDSHFINTHRPIQKKPLIVRVLTYCFFHRQIRYKLLIEQPNQKLFNSILSDGSFDQIIFNDLELLPLAIKVTSASQTKKKTARLHLDLHEFFPDHGTGFLWRLLFRYHTRWLLNLTKSVPWNSVSTVSSAIAKLYEEYEIFENVSCIYNAPNQENFSIVQCTNDRIDLVHHGVADRARGLIQLIDLINLTDQRIHLNLLLIGSRRQISKLKKKSRLNQHRIHFLEPVPTLEIAKTISQFDIEIIFFSPITQNLANCLPNKFFEAVQANLAILHGPNPEMQLLTKQFGFGICTDSWHFYDLVKTVNSIQPDFINYLKMKSKAANDIFCAETEGVKFINLISSTC